MFNLVRSKHFGIECLTERSNKLCATIYSHFKCFIVCCIIQHVEAPVPAPLKDEVLIKVEASTVNPIDCKIQGGMLRPILPRKFPFIPRKFEYVVCLLCFTPSLSPAFALIYVEVTIYSLL